jgi:hypothetical protein
VEGWLYGLFALFGVIVGGLFSYLGIKQQLKRQSEIDSSQWRRKVRGEPLLKLRDELANMATKLHILVTNTQMPSNQSIITEKEQQRALEDYRDYMTSGEFLPTLYLQYDEELNKQVDEIESAYLLLFEYALNYKNLKSEGLKTFRETSQSVRNKITTAQELINKRLEEL